MGSLKGRKQLERNFSPSWGLWVEAELGGAPVKG